MTILSSNRIIKEPEKEPGIWQYNPPVETEQKKEIKKSTQELPSVPEGEGPVSQTPEEHRLLEQWNLVRIQEKTNAIFEAIEKERLRIVEEAKELACQEQERARQAGYAKGYEEGLLQGEKKAIAQSEARLRERLSGFEKDIKKALESVEEAKEACVHTYLDELKDCAVSVAEKVIHISLKSSGEVIKQMIVAATEKLKKTAWVKIYIDKFDYDMMMKADADVIDELSHLSDNIKFIVMDKEEQGNCIIEMPDEIVDVSVNTQMENIKDILENIRV